MKFINFSFHLILGIMLLIVSVPFYLVGLLALWMIRESTRLLTEAMLIKYK